ncbi:MAG: hypothetical protein H7257_11775 [Taibaiella sp.]|nr:hypothetical protein [Taibaiella sp.]
MEEYCKQHGLWIDRIPGDDRYLTRGGEARIFLSNDNRHVIKLNDAIYYATWLEFLNSVLLHNLIFPNTSDRLLGFTKQENILFAELEQRFVLATAQVEMNDINKF